MYYKIENKECEVYKQLHELRTKELKIEKDNISSIEEKTGLKWKNSFGHHGQQNFRRVTSYAGFEFTEPKKVDLKIWKEHKEEKNIYVPNTRTKLGREMEEFLRNGLQGSDYRNVIKILKLDDLRRFKFPYVETTKDGTIILFLGDDHEPKDENVIEITKREFNDLHQ
jgi:hypothetical protein